MESEGFLRVQLLRTELAVRLQGENFVDRYITALVLESDSDADLSEN